jgi:hypothetical protein
MMVPSLSAISNSTPSLRRLRESMPAILVYGEYPSLVAARTVALWHLDCVATASLDLKETVESAGKFDAVVICTSASPEAVSRLREEQVKLPHTTFLFLGRADIGAAKRWLGRVTEWKESFARNRAAKMPVSA